MKLTDKENFFSRLIIHMFITSKSRGVILVQTNWEN